MQRKKKSPVINNLKKEKLKHYKLLINKFNKIILKLIN